MIAPHTPVVTGIGMATSLGTAQISCAAARAGLSGISLSEDVFVNDAETGETAAIQVCQIEGLCNGLDRMARCSVMGEIAVRDLAQSENLPDLSAIPAIVCVSNEYYWREHYLKELLPSRDSLPFALEETLDFEITSRLENYQNKLVPLISKLSNVPLNETSVVFTTGAQAHPIQILDSLLTKFVADEMQSCLLILLDSMIDERSLHCIDGLGLVKDANNPIGVIPGEASVAMLVERYDAAKQRQAEILGAISDCAFKVDHNHRFSDTPITGKILADTILEIVDEDVIGTVGEMIGNLNGDMWRAKEWGGSLTRLPTRIGELPGRSPSQHFGETGVCDSAIAIAMGLHDFARKGVKHNLLIWSSGDDGGKGAVILSPVH